MDASDWFALGAMIISGIALLGTFRIHHDSAGRVTVQMNIAAYQPYAGTAVFLSTDNGAFTMSLRKDPIVEMCQIILENPGRTGATVTSVGLAIEGTQRRQYTVTPRGFTTTRFGGIDSKTHFRLEPYDQHVLLFDFWSIVDSLFKEDANLREVRIRATVQVAGHEHPFMSTNHGYWRISRDTVSAMDSGKQRFFRNVLLTELARNAQLLEDTNYMDRVVVDAEEDLGADTTKEELEEYLQHEFDGPLKDLYPENAAAWAIMASTSTVWERDRLGNQFATFPARPHKKGPHGGND